MTRYRLSFVIDSSEDPSDLLEKLEASLWNEWMERSNDIVEGSETVQEVASDAIE